MDPVSGIIGGLGGLVGGIAGAISSAQGDAAKQRVLQQIMEMYQGTPLPALQSMDPILLGQSAEGAVTSDPAMQAAQMSSLGQLQDEAATGGANPADRAAMALAQNEANQQGNARQAALQNLLAARGLGSSGAAVGLMAGGAREAAQSAATASLQSQVAARQRALQAAQESGQLAGQMRGQQFAERSKTASARDQWNRYNQQSMQAAQNYNLGLPQRQFENTMQKNGAVAGAMGNFASGEQQQGHNIGSSIADLATGVGQAGAATYGAFANQPPAGPSTSYNPGASPFDDTGAYKFPWGG
jgi:hypothetical protein